MTNAFDAIEHKMGLITNTINKEDLTEHLAEVHGYIDALHDFGHISEQDADRLSLEAQELRDAKEAQLTTRDDARRRR